MDLRVVVSNFVKHFRRLVVSNDDELRAPQAVSTALDGPENASRFQVEQLPQTERLEV